jgi:hypothetical protein
MEILYIQSESKGDSVAMEQFLSSVELGHVDEAGLSGVRMCMTETLVFKECTSMAQLTHVTDCYKDLQTRQLSAPLVLTARKDGKIAYAVRRLDTFTTMGRIRYIGVYQNRKWVLCSGYQIKDVLPVKAVLRTLEVIRELLVAGWIHQDLHAGNLMFDPSTGHVRVIDLEECVLLKSKTTTPSMVKCAMYKHIIPFMANLCSFLKGTARDHLLDTLTNMTPAKSPKTDRTLYNALTRFLSAYDSASG